MITPPRRHIQALTAARVKDRAKGGSCSRDVASSDYLTTPSHGQEREINHLRHKLMLLQAMLWRQGSGRGCRVQGVPCFRCCV